MTHTHTHTDKRILGLGYTSYLHSHQKQGWVDFNTVNHHCTVGMDFHKFRSSALAILPKSRITDLPNVSQIKIRIQEYCLAKPPPANKVRFGRLLLVLPAINKFRWNFRILRGKKTEMKWPSVVVWNTIVNYQPASRAWRACSSSEPLATSVSTVL